MVGMVDGARKLPRRHLQGPTTQFPPVLEAFDRLLDAVGGRVGLAGRTER
ncbi:hypothetical protein [Streptomyces sp. NPDC012756]